MHPFSFSSWMGLACISRSSTYSGTSHCSSIPFCLRVGESIFLRNSSSKCCMVLAKQTIKIIEKSRETCLSKLCDEEWWKRSGICECEARTDRWIVKGERKVNVVKHVAWPDVWSLIIDPNVGNCHDCSGFFEIAHGSHQPLNFFTLFNTVYAAIYFYTICWSFRLFDLDPLYDVNRS